jgi:co-chaperonin GroES (HSP10)
MDGGGSLDSSKIKPRGSRILLELDESDHTFAGGELIIARVPDKEGDYPLFSQRGTVLAIGPQVKNVDVGDYVVCTKYNGVRLPRRDWDNRDLMLVKEEFVHVKIIGSAEIGYGPAYDGQPVRARRR